jgi:ATP-binding cassette subfamily B protein
LAAIGPSGAGKSTLAALALRLHDPEHGAVLIDDADIRDMKLISLRACIAFVPQEPLIVSGTIAENLGLGLDTPPSAEAMAEAIDRAALTDFLNALPAGLDTHLAERGASLSGGQKQRLSLARAFLRRTPLLILDEPTSALDGESAATVIDAIDAISEGRTTLLVTHDLRLAAQADRVATISGGRVSEIGPPTTLLHSDGWFAAAHARQTGRGQHVLSG